MQSQTPRPTARGNLTHSTTDLQGKGKPVLSLWVPEENQLIFKAQNKLFFLGRKRHCEETEWS